MQNPWQLKRFHHVESLCSGMRMLDSGSSLEASSFSDTERWSKASCEVSWAGAVEVGKAEAWGGVGADSRVGAGAGTGGGAGAGAGVGARPRLLLLLLLAADLALLIDVLERSNQRGSWASCLES